MTYEYFESPPAHNPVIACPVCKGHGTTSRPPWVAHDVSEWSDNRTGPYPCRACGGSGLCGKYIRRSMP